MGAGYEAARNEKEFQAQVRRLFAAYGWTSWHDKYSHLNEPGFPDLPLVHPSGPSFGEGRMLWLELKGPRSKERPEQFVWLSLLATVPSQDVALVRCTDPGVYDLLRRLAAGERLAAITGIPGRNYHGFDPILA